MQNDFILLDRSQSMDALWGEALSSVNAYVEKLAQESVETTVTLAVFDLDGGKLAFDIVRDKVAPKDWKAVDNSDATPRGMTPLSDAVGRIVSLAKAGNSDKTVIVIMTDGEENASKELSVSAAKKLLDDCRAKGWQVVFLGADFDNRSQAMSYGTFSAQTVSAAPENLVAMAARTAKLSANYSVSGIAMSYSDDEKKAWLKGRQRS